MDKGGEGHSRPEVWFSDHDTDQLLDRADKENITEQVRAAFLGSLGVSEFQLLPNNVIELFRSKIQK